MDATVVTASPVTLYLFCALGVLISIVLPVLRQAVITPTGRVAGVSGVLPRVFAIAKPYIATGLFSLVVGLLLVAFLKEQVADWRGALLAGYAADSTLQKLKAP